jgi:hypothetical protein
VRNWVISIVLAALATPAVAAPDYPIEAVLAEQRAFCAVPYEKHASWEEFEPEAETSFDWLRMSGTHMWGPAKEMRFPAYRKQVAGRTLLGFKARFDFKDGRRLPTYCNIYDFETRAKLDVEAWAKVIGQPDKSEAGEGFQRLAWDIDGYNGSDLLVAVQLPGMFPPPHSIGFHGLEIRSISRDIE